MEQKEMNITKTKVFNVIILDRIESTSKCNIKENV